jgi:putative tryptophan/tyrosine transport system substrate-binding protein
MQFGQNRRDFITLLGGAAAAWPLAARGQQAGIPVIGYLGAGSLGPSTPQLTAFRQSLAEAGYVEGRNMTIDYRFAEGQYDRLPALAEELVRHQAAAIVATSSLPALAAKGATASVPIVFSSTDDPVKLGLVESLSRPGGNATGVHFFLSELGAKQLSLLRELVPAAARIGLLVNPDNANAKAVMKAMTTAASAIAIEAVQASDRHGIDAAFATFVRNKVDALLVAADPFFFSQRLQLATLATRHAIPAIYNVREFAEVEWIAGHSLKLLALDHVLRDAGLSDFEAELEQLAMDARRTPQRIFRAHPPDQRAQFGIDGSLAARLAGSPAITPR